MYLYLIRHGIAVDLHLTNLESNRDLTELEIVRDESRPLTHKGRKKMVQVADRLHRSGLYFDLIITSPLVRAQQTANILIDHHLSTELEVSAHLAPAGNLQSWLQEWGSRSITQSITNLALVGHEPNLSEWAEMLIFGKVYHQLILKKGGVIGLKFLPDLLDRPDHHPISIGTAQLSCLIPPKYLTVRGC